MATPRTPPHAGTLQQVRELLTHRVPVPGTASSRSVFDVTRATPWPAAADFRVTRATGVEGESRWPRLCLEEHWTLVGPEYFLG